MKKPNLLPIKGEVTEELKNTAKELNIIKHPNLLPNTKKNTTTKRRKKSSRGESLVTKKRSRGGCGCGNSRKKGGTMSLSNLERYKKAQKGGKINTADVLKNISAAKNTSVKMGVMQTEVESKKPSDNTFGELDKIPPTTDNTIKTESLPDKTLSIYSFIDKIKKNRRYIEALEKRVSSNLSENSDFLSNPLSSNPV